MMGSLKSNISYTENLSFYSKQTIIATIGAERINKRTKLTETNTVTKK